MQRRKFVTGTAAIAGAALVPQVAFSSTEGECPRQIPVREALETLQRMGRDMMDTPIQQLLGSATNPDRYVSTRAACFGIVTSIGIVWTGAEPKRVVPAERVLGIEVTSRTTLGELVAAVRESRLMDTKVDLSWKSTGLVVEYY